MKRGLKRTLISVVLLLLIAGATYGLTEFMAKGRQPQAIASEDQLGIDSDTGSTIGTAGEGITSANGKQGEAITEAANKDPEIAEEIPTSNGGGYSGGGWSSGGGSSHSGGGSSSSGGSSGGSSSSGGGSSSGGSSSGNGSSGNWWETEGDYEVDYEPPVVENICHSCGTRYYGTGGCPNPDCEGYHPN